MDEFLGDLNREIEKFWRDRFADEIDLSIRPNMDKRQ